MLLAIDIGNTNITLGLFKKNELIKKFRIITDNNISLEEYKFRISEFINEYNIKKCIISSVVKPIDKKIKQAVDDILKIDSLILTSNSNFDMKIQVKNPEKVGIDRLANAYGAKILYKKPIIVVDIGTATTFDIVSADGNFIGGIIMPGLNLQFNSLAQNTSQLPKIDFKTSRKAIGDCTEEAMLSGILRGSACAIEGLIKQCESELNEIPTIIGTGGQCKIINDYMTKHFDIINQDLTLLGLKFLSEIN